MTKAELKRQLWKEHLELQNANSIGQALKWQLKPTDNQIINGLKEKRYVG